MDLVVLAKCNQGPNVQIYSWKCKHQLQGSKAPLTIINLPNSSWYTGWLGWSCRKQGFSLRWNHWAQFKVTLLLSAATWGLCVNNLNSRPTIGLKDKTFITDFLFNASRKDRKALVLSTNCSWTWTKMTRIRIFGVKKFS